MRKIKKYNLFLFCDIMFINKGDKMSFKEGKSKAEQQMMWYTNEDFVSLKWQGITMQQGMPCIIPSLSAELYKYDEISSEIQDRPNLIDMRKLIGYISLNLSCTNKADKKERCELKNLVFSLITAIQQSATYKKIVTSDKDLAAKLIAIVNETDGIVKAKEVAGFLSNEMGENQLSGYDVISAMNWLFQQRIMAEQARVAMFGFKMNGSLIQQ